MMKINLPRKDFDFFSEVEFGDLFACGKNDEMYIKMKNMYGFDAVSLRTGRLYSFAGNTQVRKVKAINVVWDD